MRLSVVVGVTIVLSIITTAGGKPKKVLPWLANPPWIGKNNVTAGFQGRYHFGKPITSIIHPSKIPSNLLKCGSFKKLYPGVAYTLQSPKFPANYPKRAHCRHRFRVVQACEEPQIVCYKFDVRGSPRNCKGDKLMVYTNKPKNLKKLCGKKPVSYSVKGSSRMNIRFKSNWKHEGSGYSCKVSCRGTMTTQDITTPKGPTPTKEITTPEGLTPTKEITTPEKPTPTEEITTSEEQTPTKEITTPKGSTASPENCNCGVPNRVKRIVGGVDTEMNEYPWQVGLIFSGRSKPSCGGSLISSKTILTAAHCTYGRNAGGISVLVGEHNITDPNDGQVKFEVDEIIQQPAYDSTTTDNDYSLLILVNPVEWSTEASPVAGPVCLPDGSSSSYENIEAIVSGWGTLSFNGQLSNILQEVSVKTMNNTACTTNTQYSPSWITGNMICAAASGKDACQGDSGGPLIAKESEAGDSYSQIGVVSWGIKCAEPNAPGVYSRITNKLQWIKDNMKGTTCPPA